MRSQKMFNHRFASSTIPGGLFLPLALVKVSSLLSTHSHYLDRFGDRTI